MDTPGSDETLELVVRGDRADRFRELIAGKARVMHMVELRSPGPDKEPPEGIMLFVLECPSARREAVTDYAFHSWLRSGNFQDHYETRAA